MVTTESTVGSGGDYATLALWQTSRAAAGSSGDIERAVLLDGAHTGTLNFAGWTAGVHAEIVAQNDLGDATSDNYFTDGSGVPASITFEDIAFARKQLLYLTSTLSANLDIVFRRCLIDADDSGSYESTLRTNLTSTGYALTLELENCVLYGGGTTTSRLIQFEGTGPRELILTASTLNGGLASLYAADMTFTGCLLNLDTGLSSTGTARSWVDCISSTATPTLETSTNNTFSVTFNASGDPGSGEVSFTASASDDFTLVDHANNLALGYCDTGTMPATDIVGATRDAAEDAGAYEVVAAVIPDPSGTYTGDKVDGITAITPDIHCSRTSGEASFMLQATAAGTTATGSSNPFDELCFEWSFGDTDATSVAANAMTNPVTGAAVNANTDQTGPNAVYVYRTPGSYTVTLKVWAADESGALTAYATTTQAITVSAWSGTDLYVDSVDGDDANDGLSSGAPKQTFSAAQTWIEAAGTRRLLLKKGSTFSLTSQLRLRHTRQWIQTYGSGDAPVIECGASGYINVDSANGGGCLDVCLEGFAIDGMGVRANVLSLTGNNAPSDPAGGQWRFVDLTMRNTGATSALTGAFISGTCEDCEDIGFYGCDFDIEEQGDLLMFLGMEPVGVSAISADPPSEFLSVVGCTFSGGDASPTIDHFLYLNGYNLYRTMRWLDLGGATQQSFSLNMNSPSYAGKDTEYMVIDGCRMATSDYGIDMSNANNDPTEGQHDNTIIQGCSINVGSDDGTLGVAIWGYATKRFVVRDCIGWGTPVAEFAVSDPEAVFNVYRNKFYADRGASTTTRIPLYSGQTGRFIDNNWQVLGTGTARIISAPTTVLAAITWSGNNWRAEENVDLAYDETLASVVSPATWTSTYESDATGLAPRWSDPANGDFSLVMRAGFNLGPVDYYSECRAFLNIFKHAGTPISRLSVSPFTYDDGRAVTLDSDGYVQSLLTNQEVVYQLSSSLVTGGVSGAYVLTFAGDIGFSMDGATSLSEVSTGRWTFDWDGVSDLRIYVQSIATAPSNIRVFLASNETAIDAGEVFEPLFLEQLANATSIRFMDWTRTNNSDHTSSFRDAGHAFYGGDFGVPPDVCVALANKLGVDMWYCVPHEATDGYVTALAPVLAACKNSVFVEYSNEIWNTGKGQSSYATTEGNALAGTDRLRRLYFQAKRSIEVWALLDSGGLDVGMKMVRVMAGQAADSTTMTDILAYNSAEALPLTDVISCAPYVNQLTLASASAFVQAMTVTEYWSSYVAADGTENSGMATYLATALGWVQDWLDLDLGKPIVCYEGGQHAGADDDADTDLATYLEARQQDSQMHALYTDYLDGLSVKGVEGIALYDTHHQWRGGQFWGAWDGGTFGTPTDYQKWNAVQDWLGSSSETDPAPEPAPVAVPESLRMYLRTVPRMLPPINTP